MQQNKPIPKYLLPKTGENTTLVKRLKKYFKDKNIKVSGTLFKQ